ncbi:MAG TPA: ANTAR domain-containing protein [Nocardioidaceae bacterium]|nr:ANTAR domain-containing protein [Nocardioidaceae bacterium]
MTTRDGWSASDPADGTAVRVIALEQEVSQLRQALVSRPPIDQAKGILMLRYSLDADDAFRVLMRWSMATNVKLRDVAAALVSIVGQEPDSLKRDEDLEEAVLRYVGGGAVCPSPRG